MTVYDGWILQMTESNTDLNIRHNNISASGMFILRQSYAIARIAIFLHSHISKM